MNINIKNNNKNLNKTHFKAQELQNELEKKNIAAALANNK